MFDFVYLVYFLLPCRRHQLTHRKNEMKTQISFFTSRFLHCRDTPLKLTSCICFSSLLAECMMRKLSPLSYVLLNIEATPAAD